MIMLEVNGKDLYFEHSLVSLSDWESEFERPFFTPPGMDDLTPDQMMRYFELMLVEPERSGHLARLLSHEQQMSLIEYISKGRTATTVREIQTRAPGPRENVTSELIYYWMVAFKIPFKPSDEWHLNRLLMLIKVCGHKQATPNKRTRASRAKQAQTMRELNEQRLRARGTTG